MLGPLPRTTFAHHPLEGGHEETRGHGLALRWPSSSRDDGKNVESVTRDACSTDSCGGCGDDTTPWMTWRRSPRWGYRARLAPPLTGMAVAVVRGDRLVHVRTVVVVYLLVMVALIVSIDFFFLRHNFSARLLVNVGIVVAFILSYLLLLRRS